MSYRLRAARQIGQMDRQSGGSSSGTAEAGDLTHASGMQLVMQFKQLLAAAEAKVSGYDELKALLENEQRSVRQLERALQLQQRHIDKFSAQDLLLAQLTQQIALQAHSYEQLQSRYHQHSQTLASAKSDADRLEQEVGQKRKRIESLEWRGSHQEQCIKRLEHQLKQYKRICSYVADESKSVGHIVERSQVRTSSELEEASLGTAGRRELQDTSLAEGAAGQLAMPSTADRTLTTEPRGVAHQSLDRQGPPVPSGGLPLVNTSSSDAADHSPVLELEGLTVPKRASCLIIGRHPEAPKEVKVICKQLTGLLQLGNCGSRLCIKVQGSKLMTPPEFEATAGCSKGKNWKANIKVQGRNNRPQMLKLWLPGLVQLVGDHAKAAVAKDAHIDTLLDRQTGLRILPTERTE